LEFVLSREDFLSGRYFSRQSSDKLDSPWLTAKEQMSGLGAFKKKRLFRIKDEGFLWLAFS
jgi:hypothetical protein